MSGGSYNYLYSYTREDDVLADRQGSLLEMADRLENYAPNHPVTRYTTQLARLHDKDVPEEVLEVWHAVEWWDSLDSTENAVIDALKAAEHLEP